MNLEDTLCLTLLSGIRDARLREKLSELEQPTLPAFGVIIDAYLHSKATLDPPAAANHSEGRNHQKNKNKNRGGQKITDAEKKPRAAMEGKCFRCGSGEHMANNCMVAKDVKCQSCREQGHIQSACGPEKARSTEEAPGEILWRQSINSISSNNQQGQITIRLMLHWLLRLSATIPGLLLLCCCD